MDPSGNGLIHKSPVSSSSLQILRLHIVTNRKNHVSWTLVHFVDLEQYLKEQYDHLVFVFGGFHKSSGLTDLRGEVGRRHQKDGGVLLQRLSYVIGVLQVPALDCCRQGIGEVTNSIVSVARVKAVTAYPSSTKPSTTARPCSLLAPNTTAVFFVVCRFSHYANRLYTCYESNYLLCAPRYD